MAILISLLTALSVHASIYPSSITFGSTFNSDPKLVTYDGALNSVSTLPTWLRVDTSTPGTLKFYADVSKVPVNGQNVTIDIMADGSRYVLTVLAKCSTSSGCGGGNVTPGPTQVPTAQPSPSGTPQPSPTSTVVPTPTAPPVSDDARTAPLRPTFREVSTKLDKIVPYVWYQGKTATQTQRDAMEETRVMGMALGIRMIRALPRCASVQDKYGGILGEITSLLGPVYEVGISLKEGEGGHWSVDPNGRHYSKENYFFKDARSCALNDPVACATVLSPDFLDLFDLRVENGKCVAGALFTVPPPTEKRNSYREQLGMVQAETLMPRLTTEQVNLLEASHNAHHAVTKFKCGEGPQPEAGIVTKTHLALEASARNEPEHHFFRMKDFSGSEDPLWTREQICKLAKLQDLAHHRWKEQVLIGRWGRSRLFENDHQNMHICMNLKHPRLLIRMSCATKINSCPKETCESYITRTSI